MRALAILAIGCAAFGGFYQLFQWFAAWRFFRRAARSFRLPAPGVPLPPVTLLKPLRGPGIDLYENLESFCRQDYPAAWQIVFGVEDPADPAVPIVERLRRAFPRLDIVLSVADMPGTNRKVANLRHMMRHARHDLLIMSDADIRVRPDYIRTLVAPFVDPVTGPRVGMATCLYRGVGHFGLPSVMESLFINTDFFPMVLTAQLVDKFEYGYGASIAIRREALDQAGGFAPIADFLADDALIGYRIARAGWGLVLAPYTVETMLDSRTLGDVWRHLLRWSRTNRAVRPVSWFFVVVTHATLWGCLSLLATGGSPAGWLAFTWALGCRLAGTAGVLSRLGERETIRYLWLVPLKDLCHSLLWAVTFLGNRVTWSGQDYSILPDGRMVPLSPPTATLVAAPADRAGFRPSDDGPGAVLAP